MDKAKDRTKAHAWWESIRRSQYISKKFKGAFKRPSLLGNVFLKEKKNEVFVHLHPVLGDENFKVIADHSVEARVSRAGEVFIEKTPFAKRKFLDKEIGLYLIKE